MGYSEIQDNAKGWNRRELAFKAAAESKNSYPWVRF